MDYHPRGVFLLVSIAVLLTLSFFFFLPFLSTLFMTAILATAGVPLLNWLQSRKLPRMAAVVIVYFSIILLFLVPSLIFLLSLLDDVSAVANNIVLWTQALPQKLQLWLSHMLPEGSGIKEYVDMAALRRSAAEWGGRISAFLLNSATAIATGLANLTVQLIVFFFALFYMLLDGWKLVDYLKRLLPLSVKQTELLVSKIHDLMMSITLGILGAAIAQGITLWIGFSMVGVNNAIFWATLAAVLSPVPYIGVGLVWMPTVAVLFANNDITGGFILLAWCLLIVANIDNIVKPYLIGNRSALHPFVVMLMILGGVFAFGFKGLIFGPLVLTLLLAVLHIYEHEFLQPIAQSGEQSAGPAPASFNEDKKNAETKRSSE